MKIYTTKRNRVVLMIILRNNYSYWDHEWFIPNTDYSMWMNPFKSHIREGFTCYSIKSKRILRLLQEHRMGLHDTDREDIEKIVSVTIPKGTRYGVSYNQDRTMHVERMVTSNLDNMMSVLNQ